MINNTFINLSSYDIPKAVELRNKNYVSYGEDNDYYSFLIESYLQSATNNAAIRSISSLVYGRGLSIVDMDETSDPVKDIKKLINHKELKKIILERKLLGQAAIQVIYNKEGNSRTVVRIKHFPMHTLRPEKMDEDGVINAYYYHPKWKEKKSSDVLKRIPTFGTSKEKIELYILKPYVSGYSYFSPVDYSGSLPYAEMENEISDYLLNEVKNSFSGTKIVNMNNGVPDQEQMDSITRSIKDKLTGARGQKLIVSFNDNPESKTTVEDISLNDAPAHYEYLATEAKMKILVGHRVTSPMLLGIKETGNGLASNSDEIMTASQLFNSTVIQPYQDEVVEALEEILEINGEVPELYFITSQPIEFTKENQGNQNTNEEQNTESVDRAKEEISKEDETDKETNLSANFKTEEQIDWLTNLNKKSEQIDLDEWILVDASIDNNETAEENWETMLNTHLSTNFAAAQPDDRAKDSVQDDKWLKVRYKYVQGSKKHGVSTGKSSRPFCVAMENAGGVYRKEDITKMQLKGVNSELGHNQNPYSIWLHKGGVNCYHAWQRLIYMKRSKVDGTPWGGNAMNGVKKISANSVRGLDQGKRRNDKRVAEAQIDRADKGHHPSYSKGKKRK